MPGVKGQRSGGHNAKTAQQHRLEGTFQRVRHAGTSGPDVVSGIPVPSKPLEGEAAEEWDRMIVYLTRSGTLSANDGAILYQYCRVFAETEGHAQRQSENAGSIDIMEENLSGLEGADLVAAFQEITKLSQNEFRYCNLILKGRMAQRQLLGELGLTPSSRGRVKVPDKQEADPFSEFDGGSVQ